MSSSAVEYYHQRWSSEGKANLWAMARAAAILSAISRLGVKEPRILDYGCGTGWLTSVLNEFGEADGVDLAPQAAKQRYPLLRFFVPEDLPRSAYDVVVSQEVIEHCEDQRLYLASAASLLRAQGWLVITTPNASVTRYHPELKNQPLEKHLTTRQLRSLLQEHFQVDRIESFFFGYARLPFRLQMHFGKHLNAGMHLLAVAWRKS